MQKCLSYFDDALVVTKELEIALTGRECGLPEKAPMCGVPHHSAENYIARLIEKGYKVAICEQIEEASKAKGLVKRDVVRVITPGTTLDSNTLQAEKNNYIAVVVYVQEQYGFSFCDVSTGEWSATRFEKKASFKKAIDEITKFMPVECLISDNLKSSEIAKFLKTQCQCLVEIIPNNILDSSFSESLLKNHFNLLGIDGIGLQVGKSDTLAVSTLLNYLKETQKNTLSHLQKIEIYNTEAYMVLDNATRRNLEICETLREKKRKGSLLWILDETKTAMGARYLKKCIDQPLVNLDEINERLDAIEELVRNIFLQDDLKEALKKIYDIERLVSKIAHGSCNAKELTTLKFSIAKLPDIYGILKNLNANIFKLMYSNWDTMEDVYTLIDDAILEDTPLSVREGGLIKIGYNEEIDRLKQIKEKGASWLRDIEAKERQKTGIKNLKIKYNKVFGYFLEVTHTNAHLVPEYFIRKQTLASCERYITEELKTIEEDILGADEKLVQLEYQIFSQIREHIKEHSERLLNISHNIAKLDMLCSLSSVAIKNHYVRPKVHDGDTIDIKEGRHPVIENMMNSHNFIANDTYLNETTDQLLLITGPNMAGKSTVMRQVALIVLMAQIGSFVPANYANIGIVDRIFTRVGASDDLASGQSTFMVEMMEVANILHHATSKSLLILDEIGRGTSTIDGLSIAWSIIEHLVNNIKAKTMFATHYHELTMLSEQFLSIKNYCVSVKEVGEDIIFLHKIVSGNGDKSYGIQVAKLAGVPITILHRAKEIMVEVAEKTPQTTFVEPKQIVEEIHPAIEKLEDLNVMELTPMQALEVLDKLQKLVRG
ncbi:MAG: DNA mismatch repair protein MutS [Epulopiscium sp. Nele67-Bin005]|nr:MAG: DNA mismatch repair protein MutS [Epulopiscium sp. Nele67-Bin005]